MRVSKLLSQLFSDFPSANLDTVKIGPYIVANCKSNNNNIVTLLKSLGTVVRPAITDLDSPVSSDAYTTFFKDIAYKAYIRDIFTNVSRGASVLVQPGSSSSAPVFICVDGRDQVNFVANGKRVDAYTRCRSYTEAPAMALLTTPYIVICPAFWTHPAIPSQSSTNCYDVGTQGKYFVQDGKSWVKYQIWHLMHEMIHFYVWATKQMNDDVFGINQCVDLIGGRAVLNPQSYTYYATS